MPHVSPLSNVLRYISRDRCAARVMQERWGWVELFVAIQFLWGALLFVPGAQPYRMYIRALPYVASLGALVFVDAPQLGRAALRERQVVAGVVRAAGRESAPCGDASERGPRADHLPDQHRRTDVLGGSECSQSGAARSTAVGHLCRELRQRRSRCPAGLLSRWFLPAEFSALARSLNPAFVDALSYIGPDGRPIIRPPGLSDLPGGAAVAGLTTVVLAVAYASHARNSRPVRILSVGAAAVGMTALYLTQVRSLTVMAALGVLLFAAIRLRQGRVLQSGWIAMSGVALVAASFMWAVAIGGGDRRSLLEPGRNRASSSRFRRAAGRF